MEPRLRLRSNTESPSTIEMYDDITSFDINDKTKEKGDEEAEVEVTIEQEERKGLELRRTVTLMGAISFTVGSMIGSGIFITPTSVLANTGSVALNLIVWGIGGVLSLLGSFMVSELACRIPKHGALYAYVTEGFGAWLGFVYTWNQLLIGGPSSLAVQALTFSRYCTSMMEMCGKPEKPVQVMAVTLIVTLGVIAIISNRLSVRLNVVFLFAKVIALVFIIIGGIVAFATGKRGDSELSLGFGGTTHSPAEIAKSFYFVMYAYGGWSNANGIVEEVKNPKRNVPLAAIIGVLLVTVIYVFTNVSYLAVMSRDQMLSADTVAVTWGEALLGSGAASLIIPLCVMASTTGTANASIFGGPRLIFAASRDGNFPEVLSFLHVNKRTPIPAIIVMVVLGMVYASFSNVIQLIQVLGFTEWMFYFLSGISLLIIRYRARGQDDHVPFKQPLVVIVSFTLFSLYLVVMPLTENADIGLAYAFAFLVLGVIVFFVFKYAKDRIQCCDGLVTSVQLLLQVGPPAAYSASS